ncbi:MAG: SDR family NAD(P)-dependent oxidoreductase [Propionibacterium sp.]|nr:SDR family NAD(P)-dependent oxidoreductase [Propionibacterium sp.]
MSTLDFTGRSIIVTGAGRGIGREYVRLLAGRGAKVAVVDPGATADGAGLAGDDPAGEVADEATAAGGTAVAIRESVATEDGARRIVEQTVEAFGGVDAVINNAGVLHLADFEQLGQEEYQRHLDVHFFGSVWLAKAAWSALRASGTGRIVNTISAAMLGNPQMAHYGSSKGAVFGLTRNLAIEGLADGILVNAVAPGAGGTRLMEASVASLPEEIVEYMKTSLLPELVAPVGAYLAHQQARVTGEVFNVAGGFVNRMAIVNSGGFHSPDLSVEDVADNFEQIMTMPEGSQVQAVPQPGETGGAA